MKAINIISFDVPYPANYGGIIDIFYKLKYLHSKGVKIHLHCFEYGRGESKELNNYCASIHYYKRKTGIISLFSSIPYIVKSRTSKKLKAHLLKNDFPILFEGLHSCFLLNDKHLKNRFKIFRESNIEHHYYHHLAKAESHLIKKIYYLIEAKKLKRFEPIIQNANVSFVVSHTDLDYFQNKYPKHQFKHVPSFHASEKVVAKKGNGEYVLYHGNLSVPENSHAAQFIIKTIFKDNNIPLIIAGLDPPSHLVHLIHKYDHIQLIANPKDGQMNELIANAQINFLYTEQATGLKLKLLHVLYHGRHCVVNSKMIEGTSLAKCCLVADHPNELKELISATFLKEINEKEITLRESILEQDYANENSYQKIVATLPKNS